jgi:hypothetical protein
MPLLGYAGAPKAAQGAKNQTMAAPTQAAKNGTAPTQGAKNATAPAAKNATATAPAQGAKNATGAAPVAKAVQAGRHLLRMLMGECCGTEILGLSRWSHNADAWGAVVCDSVGGPPSIAYSRHCKTRTCTTSCVVHVPALVS